MYLVLGMKKPPGLPTAAVLLFSAESSCSLIVMRVSSGQRGINEILIRKQPVIHTVVTVLQGIIEETHAPFAETFLYQLFAEIPKIKDRKGNTPPP